jgi:hypothetical protein
MVDHLTNHIPHGTDQVILPGDAFREMLKREQELRLALEFYVGPDGETDAEWMKRMRNDKGEVAMNTLFPCEYTDA